MTGLSRRVKKEDFSRILLTETSSYDVPVTFSNVGFYWHWKKFEEGRSFFPEIMEFLFQKRDLSGYTIPLHYKIRKDEKSYRSLSLIHPATQVKFIDFYKSFDQKIVEACAKSEFSIRSPANIASKYYVKSENENSYKFRSEEVTTRQSESKSRFLTSYFSYKGYNRLHHFFDSQSFVDLERKYSSFWSVDISKCFDSIYTHSITWAMKEKAHSKFNASIKNTFGSLFDTLMQRSNYNETAGIVIGPEVSRIFAEIIFQKIDGDVERELEERNLKNNVHYTIRRYVDDIFIFATSDNVADSVLRVVETSLKAYKLSLNTSKTVKAARPFITGKSRSLQAVKKSLKNLFDRLLSPNPDDNLISDVETSNSLKYKPTKIFNRRKLIISFLNEIKSACTDSTDAYEMVSGYLISALSNLIVKFSEGNANYKFPEDASKKGHADFFLILIELVFHFYTISPSQGGSVKICIMADQACRYFDGKISESSHEVRSLIYTLANNFFESSAFHKLSNDKTDFALLEALNVLVALKLLGSKYLVSRDILNKIVNFAENRALSYFEITTLLFYIGDDPEKSYSAIKAKIIKDIDKSLSDLSDVRISAEKAYLLLDILACPFVEDTKRRTYIRRLISTATQSAPEELEVVNMQKKFARYRWFTSWNRAELLSSLEKKALLKSY
jgi:hypothetical protein